MAPRLEQIVPSGSVNPGAQVALAYNLNYSNRTAVLPTIVALDNPNFDVVLPVTTTTITVVNNGPGAETCNVWLKVDHTYDAEYGGVQITSLVPQPFIIRGAAPSSSPASSIQAFRYTAVGGEVDFMVNLPAARATDSYAVEGNGAGLASIVGFDFPDLLAADRTTTQFRVKTTAALTAGDQIDFIIVSR